MDEKSFFQELRELEDRRAVAVHDVRAEVWREISSIEDAGVCHTDLVGLHPNGLRLGFACAASIAAAIGIGAACLHSMTWERVWSGALLEIWYYMI